MDEVKIGDFSKRVAEQLPAGAPKPALDKGVSPEADRFEAVEKRLDVQAQETEEALHPKISYEELLKANGITKEEAAKIVDDVLFKGVYTEEVPVSKRVKAAFRTRNARDTIRTMQYLEVAKPIYENHFNEIVATYTLAASLERLGRDAFDFPKKDAPTDKIEEAFQNRVSYVSGLPDPVLRLLYLKLGKFDEKIRVVLSEGAIENF
jgi:hypothetical protein